MNTNNSIEYILFDIGGVIIVNDKINYQDFDNELSLESGTVKGVIDDCFYKSAKGGNFDIKKYIEEHYKNIIAFDEYESIMKKVYGAERVNDELVQWINLNKNRFHMCALSNNTKALRKLLADKFNIADMFEVIFNSAEIGLAKPDPKLFAYVVEKLNSNPDQCLFIDDNVRNIEAAANLGFKTIHFTGNDSFFEKIEERV